MGDFLLHFGAHTADAVTTCWGFARGAVEQNPFAPHTCAGIVAFKASLSVGVWELGRYIHNPAARWLIRAFALVTAGVAAHNFSVIWSLR